MSTETALKARSGTKCELCESSDGLAVYEVPPRTDGGPDSCILLCATCHTQIEDPAASDMHHWRCLKDSMWSQIPAVQVMACRMLDRLSGEAWARDLRDMLYLEDDVLAWAGSTAGGAADDDGPIRHLDCNGAALSAGDDVTLIKDLTVKGANFTAKRGTAVRGISLVSDNPLQIEGRVNGQRIVLLTEFVKKSSA